VDYFIEPNGAYRHFQGRATTRNFRFYYLPSERRCIGFDELFAETADTRKLVPRPRGPAPRQ
jgi:hypothetical protein